MPPDNFEETILKELTEIAKILKEISAKVDLVIKSQATSEQAATIEKILGKPTGETKALDVMTLLSLPDHLRKAAIALYKIGRGTAEDVAKETKRARAVESGYLNQLVAMGHVKKERVGRKVYFYI